MPKEIWIWTVVGKYNGRFWKKNGCSEYQPVYKVPVKCFRLLRKKELIMDNKRLLQIICKGDAASGVCVGSLQNISTLRHPTLVRLAWVAIPTLLWRGQGIWSIYHCRLILVFLRDEPVQIWEFDMKNIRGKHRIISEKDVHTWLARTLEGRLLWISAKQYKRSARILKQRKEVEAYLKGDSEEQKLK